MAGVVILALIVLIVLMGIWSQAATVVEWAIDRWKKKGFIIECGPVEAQCYDWKPTSGYYYTPPHYGALAILNTGFAFASRRFVNCLVPFESVCWIGHITTKVRGNRAAELLIVHCIEGQDWHVYAFDAENTDKIAQELSLRCGMSIVEMGEQRESYGPQETTRVEQDIYGHWQPCGQGRLYLAPDRLLFSSPENKHRVSVLLTKIQAVSALTKDNVLHDLNPFSEDLLRIEYQEVPDTKPLVVGFLVHNAEAWAAAIQRRGVKNVSIHTGRKKKAGKDERTAVADFVD